MIRKDQPVPRGKRNLRLHEEILLIALRDEKGTLIRSCGYPMAGAILAELLLARRLEVTPDQKKLVECVDASATGDPIFDECLDRMRTAKRRASLRTWVSRLASTTKFVPRVAAGLCERGVLLTEQDKVLLIFNRTVYPELDPKPERELVERLRKAIFTETRQVDPRTVLLLSIAHGADMLKIPFDRRKLRGRKKRIEALTNGDLLGSATKEAIQAAQTAAVMAAIMPAVMVTTVACHS
ncbi:MAG: GPP34 family phosphoprotein [Phycisphaerae bacterium]|jgi:hypothetical protein